MISLQLSLVLVEQGHVQLHHASVIYTVYSVIHAANILFQHTDASNRVLIVAHTVECIPNLKVEVFLTVCITLSALT